MLPLNSLYIPKAKLWINNHANSKLMQSRILLKIDLLKYNRWVSYNITQKSIKLANIKNTTIQLDDASRYSIGKIYHWGSYIIQQSVIETLHVMHDSFEDRLDSEASLEREKFLNCSLRPQCNLHEIKAIKMLVWCKIPCKVSRHYFEQSFVNAILTLQNKLNFTHKSNYFILQESSSINLRVIQKLPLFSLTCTTADKIDMIGLPKKSF